MEWLVQLHGQIVGLDTAPLIFLLNKILTIWILQMFSLKQCFVGNLVLSHQF